MAASEQVLGLVVSAKDEASATLQAVDKNLAAVGKTAATASTGVAKFGTALADGRSHIGKFAAAGAQMNLVLSTLGPGFTEALGPAGNFIKIVGNIGLIASTAAELIPLATAATTALGTASAASAVPIEAAGAAAGTAALEYDALAVSEANATAASPGFLLGLAGVAVAGAAAAVALETYSEGLDKAQASTREAARAAEEHQTILALYPGLATAFGTGMDDGAKSLFDLNAASIASREGFNELGIAIGKVDIGITQLFGTQKVAADAAQAHRLALVGEQGASLSAALGMQNLAGATAGVTAKTNENIGALSAEAAALNHVSYAASVAAANLSALGTAQSAANAANNARLRQLGETPGAGVSGALQHGYVPAMPVDIPGVGNFVAPKAPKGAKGAKGPTGPTAAELAAQIAKETAAAYDEATKAADGYFSAVHDNNMKAIDDAHKVANAKIKAEQDAANQAIRVARDASKKMLSDALDAIKKELAARKAANAAPVTAAERAQSAVEAGQQLRDLNESLQAAQKSGDVIAIRDASEALQNFQAHQAIDSMKAAQDAADAAAQAWADAATEAANTAEAQRQADLDQQQKDADAKYAKQQADEDKRFTAQQTAEDKRWILQSKKIDEQIAATADSAKANIKNANATTLLYLTNALLAAAAADDAAGQVAAQRELDDFKRSIGQAPKRAAGGPVSRGGLYLVGEQGPELFAADSNGTIYPGGMGGGASLTFNSTVNVSGADNPERWATRYVQEVARRLRREGIVA